MDKKKIKLFIKSYRQIFIFIFNLGILYGIYLVFYYFFRYKTYIHEFYEFGTQSLTTIYLALSKGLLSFFGYDTMTTKLHIAIIGDNGIVLNRGCLGRNLKLIYTGLVLAFPVSVKLKLKYLVIGLLCIFCANTIRVSALAYIHAFHREYFQATHNLVFKIFVYALTFLMWHLMFKEYSKRKHKATINNKDKG